MHRIIRVYSLLAVLLDPIVHVFLENTVYGVYTVHRIIRVYSMLSKEKGPYGATMSQYAQYAIGTQLSNIRGEQALLAVCMGLGPHVF